MQPCDHTALQAQLPRRVHRAMAAPAGHVRHLPSLQAHRVWPPVTQLSWQPEEEGADASYIATQRPDLVVQPAAGLMVCCTRSSFWLWS